MSSAADPHGLEKPLAWRRFELFVFLWCSATLLHQLYQGRLLVLDATAPLTFAALFALARPASLGRFTLLIAIHLATVLWELPRVVNHWLLMGVTCVGLLIVLLPALREQRRGSATTGLPESALGPVRLQLILIYAFATFHKLNAGFFDPELSCGVEHYTRLADDLGFLPRAAWTRTPAILGTLAIEAALPVLLAFRATRTLALPFGWGFHLMLGWNGYWDFSAVGSAYYAAFLPLSALAGFDRARARHRWLARLGAGAARIGASPWLFPACATALTASLSITWWLDAGAPYTILAVNRAGRFVWLALWLVLGGLLGLALLESRHPTAAEAEPRPAWWRRPVLWIAPLVLFANGFSPYLGLKSEHSYAMFSNLRTEGGSWNHYLMPPSMRTFEYADEVIWLQGSTDPYLRNLAAHGFGLVPLELRSHLAGRPGVAVTYLRGGRVVRSARAADDPYLAQPVHPLERKLILFRPVPPRGGNACLH